MQISDHVHLIPARRSAWKGPFAPNVYVVAQGDSAILIDSGFGDPASLRQRAKALEELSPKRFSHILLTHTHIDHCGGAHTFRTRFGAQVGMHALEQEKVRAYGKELRSETTNAAAADLDAEPMPKGRVRRRTLLAAAAESTPDVLLQDGDRIHVGGLTLEVVHTPGHTHGHLCFYLREERLLFSGDTILGAGTVAVSPPPGGDMGAYLRSLERLQELAIERACPGHGPVLDDPRAKAAELIAHRQMREAQILGFVRDGISRLPALRQAVYPDLDRRLHFFARGQLRSHLAKLAIEDKVRLQGEGNQVRFFPVEGKS